MWPENTDFDPLAVHAEEPKPEQEHSSFEPIHEVATLVESVGVADSEYQEKLGGILAPFGVSVVLSESVSAKGSEKGRLEYLIRTSPEQWNEVVKAMEETGIEVGGRGDFFVTFHDFIKGYQVEVIVRKEG